jgi:hypothetical protein
MVNFNLGKNGMVVLVVGDSPLLLVEIGSVDFGGCPVKRLGESFRVLVMGLYPLCIYKYTIVDY